MTGLEGSVCVCLCARVCVCVCLDVLECTVNVHGRAWMCMLAVPCVYAGMKVRTCVVFVCVCVCFCREIDGRWMESGSVSYPIQFN